MRVLRLVHRAVVLLAAALLVGGFRPQAQPVRPALDVIQRAVRELYRAVIERVPAMPAQVYTTNHPDQLWLSQELYATYQEVGRTAMTSTDTLTLVFSNVSMRYENVDAADSVRRIITVDVGARIVRNGSNEVLPMTPIVDTVVCSRAEARAAESLQHSCTSSQMPEPPTSFWDTVMEPMIFVAAAVATVVLLFTVRSQ